MSASLGEQEDREYLPVDWRRGTEIGSRRARPLLTALIKVQAIAATSPADARPIDLLPNAEANRLTMYSAPDLLDRPCVETSSGYPFTEHQ